MPSTSRGYPYPSGSDDVDIPGDMQALADALNTDVGTVVTNAAAASAATIQNTLADAAGDLIVASANDLWAKKPLGTDNHVLTVDTAGSGVAKVGWEDPTANPLTVAAMAAKVNTATVGNLLTANQASIETDTTGFTAASCTLLASASYALFGAKSLEVTATAAGPQPYIGGDSSYGTIAVTGGQTYTFMASALAPTITRDWSLRIYWFTSAGDVAASTAYSDSATLALSSSWKTNRAVAVAPANAAYASLRLNASGGYSATEVFYMDGVSFHQGAGGQWSLPGTPITNLGFYTDESVGRRLFQWDANNARWQQTYSDSGLRDTAVTVANSWAIYGGYNHIRRVGNVVSLNLWLDSTSASSDTVGTIPAGFRPDRTVGFGVLAPGNLIRLLQISSAGSLDATTGGTTPGAAWFVQATWVTNDAWPTTLPGSAVGSIPA